MVTEGLKGVQENSEKEREEMEDEDDYLDEYGNLKDDVNSGDDEVKTTSESKNADDEDPKKMSAKSNKGKGKKNNQKTSGEGWKDLDGEKTQSQSEEVKKYVSSAVKLPDTNKMMFPRDSSLNWYEQATFLHKLSLARTGQFSPGPDWTVYQNFKSLVDEEQEEFNQFTRENFSPTPTSLSEDHRKYVTDHRAARLSRPLSLPRWWTKLKDVRLAGEREDQLCALIVEQSLVELGSRPKANIPCLIRNNRGKKSLHGMSVPSQYLRMVHKVPPDPDIKPGTIGLTRGQERRRRRQGEDTASEPELEEKVDHAKFLYKESCIDDANCGLLAQLVVPDIIISAAAMKCLMDNHRPHFSKTWEIPFVVRTFQSERDTRTVVVFGKPLLPREVTDEDFSLLAHKIAVQVGFFQRDWESQVSKQTKKKLVECVSPVEDPFGADVAIEDLEVFGGGADINTNSLSNLFKKSDASQKKIAQVDGADTDSEEESLVINESPRRSSRLRVSESEPAQASRGARGGRGGRRSTRANNKQPQPQQPPAPVPAPAPASAAEVEEELDYEPEENSRNPTDVESSSSDSECEDKVQAMLLEKMNLVENSKLETKTTAESAESSSDEEEDPALLIEKKMRAANKQGTQPENEEEEDSSDESSSESDAEGLSLLQRKMFALNSSQVTEKEESEKEEKMEVESDIGTVPEVTTQEKEKELDLADTEESAEREESDDEVNISPQKRRKRVLSSESEEEKVVVKEPALEKDPIARKLQELGRENVDVKKLTRKISLEKKLKSLSESKLNKTSLQNEEREQRVSNRKKTESVSNKNLPKKAKEEGEVEKKKVQESPKMSSMRNLTSSSDSEEEEGRFDKFSSSSSQQTQPNLLDNLLTGQNRLLSSECRKKVMEERCPQGPAVFEKLSTIAAGLPPVEQFKPPLPGTNVSYRLWKLYDKAAPARVLRVLVRSKVAGLTREEKMLTPSVKVEHQAGLGAEQVTASQASREWISTLLRPGSCLARVRVLPDSKISMVEEKSLAELTAECRRLSSDPGKQLVNLYNVFAEVSSLRAGQYILKHSSKTGAFCEVYEAAVDGSVKKEAGPGTLDLHKLYNTLDPGATVPGKIPYSPVDTTVVTPWHIVNGRVPGTFQPAGERKEFSGGARGARGGRGGRGGKARGRGRGRGNKK